MHSFVFFISSAAASDGLWTRARNWLRQSENFQPYLSSAEIEARADMRADLRERTPQEIKLRDDPRYSIAREYIIRNMLGSSEGLELPKGLSISFDGSLNAEPGTPERVALLDVRDEKSEVDNFLDGEDKEIPPGVFFDEEENMFIPTTQIAAAVFKNKGLNYQYESGILGSELAKAGSISRHQPVSELPPEMAKTDGRVKKQLRFATDPSPVVTFPLPEGKEWSDDEWESRQPESHSTKDLKPAVEINPPKKGVSVEAITSKRQLLQAEMVKAEEFFKSKGLTAIEVEDWMSWIRQYIMAGGAEIIPAFIDLEAELKRMGLAGDELAQATKSMFLEYLRHGDRIFDH